jgi:hypothetical protein
MAGQSEAVQADREGLGHWSDPVETMARGTRASIIVSNCLALMPLVALAVMDWRKHFARIGIAGRRHCGKAFGIEGQV